VINYAPQAAALTPTIVIAVLFGLVWWFALVFFGIRHGAVTKKDPKLLGRLKWVKTTIPQFITGALLAGPFVAVLCTIMTFRSIGRYSTMFGGYYFVAMLASAMFGAALAIHLYGDSE